MEEKYLGKQHPKLLAAALNWSQNVTLKPCSSGTWVNPMSINATWGLLLLTGFALSGIAATRVEAACGSSGAALRTGIYAVLSGLSDVVIVGGVEKMTHRTTAEVTEYLAMAADYPFEQFHGITFPGLFAMMATAHMHDYGTTEQQIAKIAVKNHHHGSLNPKAHMQKEVPLETVMGSKYVAWPAQTLRLQPNIRRRKLHHINQT